LHPTLADGILARLGSDAIDITVLVAEKEHHRRRRRSGGLHSWPWLERRRSGLLRNLISRGSLILRSRLPAVALDRHIAAVGRRHNGLPAALPGVIVAVALAAALAEGLRDGSVLRAGADHA